MARAGLVVGAEVASMEEASRVIAQAQAEEADALLAAVAAQAEAAQAVTDSERIQAAAEAAHLPLGSQRAGGTFAQKARRPQPR